METIGAVKDAWDIWSLISSATKIAGGGPLYWIVSLVALFAGFYFMYKGKEALRQQAKADSDQKWQEEKSKNDTEAGSVQDAWNEAEQSTTPPESNLPRRPK